MKKTDTIIIGAGPVGLFAIHQLGIKGLKSIVIDNLVFGEVLYRQIAGALAKRIVNYAKEGKKVIQGTDAGFIKFGSRVDIFLPLGTKLNVNIGDKVKGGVQVIAEK